MKRFLALTILTLASAAYAQTIVEGTVNGDAAANNAGNNQAITFTSPADSHSTLKSAPPVSAPPLTSSNDTCMGSISAGGAVVGLGVTIGSTYESESCVALKEGRELWNWGLRDAALARLCMLPRVKEAVEITGRECPQTTAARKKAEAAK
jgi:hypothetical protein